MIAYLHGLRASLDHRAGVALAALDLPAGTLVDPERDRAKVPGDPAGWITGVGLILHARANLLGVMALYDDYAGAGRKARPTPTTGRRPKLRHVLPRDLGQCLRCRRLILFARDPENGESWPVEPSRWIAGSIVALSREWPTPIAYSSPGRLPAVAGEPHQCLALFGG